MKNTRREQVKRVRKYEKERKSLQEFVEKEYVEDGRAVLTLYLKDDSTLYEPFSYGSQKDLSSINDKIRMSKIAHLRMYSF